MSLHRLQSTSDRPLYRQLVDWLRADLATKAPGDRIDSEPQLARRFGVSRFTVTRAIEILGDEGLVSRRQGLGSFVAAPPLKRTPSYLLSFTEAVQSQGRFASHRFLNSDPSSGGGSPISRGLASHRPGSTASGGSYPDRYSSLNHLRRGCERHRSGRRDRASSAIFPLSIV